MKVETLRKVYETSIALSPVQQVALVQIASSVKVILPPPDKGITSLQNPSSLQSYWILDILRFCMGKHSKKFLGEAQKIIKN